MNAATAPMLATLSEFARLADFKPSYVTQLRKEGRLVLDGKRVRVAESLQRIKDTSDPSKAGVAARHAAERAARRADIDDAETPAPIEPGTRAFHDSRAEREKWNAKMAQLDYERSIGKLLDAEQVQAAAAAAATIFRTSIELLPDVLAPQVNAAAGDESRVRAILAEALEYALAELERKFTMLAKAAA